MTAPLAVLVVDDNDDFLHAAGAVLRSVAPRCAVHTADSATSALTFLERRGPHHDAPQPAFIVLDYYLPDLNAPALLARLRAVPALAGLPVFVLSQANWEGEEARVLAAGATRFRVKPSRAAALREALLSFWKEEVHVVDDSPRRG